MDSKFNALVDALKSILPPQTNGRQWIERSRAKKTKSNPPTGRVQFGFPEGDLERKWAIVENAEDLTLFTGGQGNRRRMKRHELFAVKSTLVKQESANQRLGGLTTGGRCFELHEAITGPQMFKPCLLAGAQHIGRKVRVGWLAGDLKVLRMSSYIRREFVVEKHLARYVWLDRAPEEEHDFPVLIFE